MSPYPSDDVSESDVTFDSDDDRNTDDMIRKMLSEMKDDFDADEFDIESIIDDVESEMDQSTDDSDTDTSERDS